MRWVPIPFDYPWSVLKLDLHPTIIVCVNTNNCIDSSVRFVRDCWQLLSGEFIQYRRLPWVGWTNYHSLQHSLTFWSRVRGPRKKLLRQHLVRLLGSWESLQLERSNVKCLRYSTCLCDLTNGFLSLINVQPLRKPVLRVLSRPQRVHCFHLLRAGQKSFHPLRIRETKSHGESIHW
jgi:hypothetical protein